MSIVRHHSGWLFTAVDLAFWDREHSRTSFRLAIYSSGPGVLDSEHSRTSFRLAVHLVFWGMSIVRKCQWSIFTNTQLTDLLLSQRCLGKSEILCLFAFSLTCSGYGVAHQLRLPRAGKERSLQGRPRSSARAYMCACLCVCVRARSLRVCMCLCVCVCFSDIVFSWVLCPFVRKCRLIIFSRTCGRLGFLERVYLLHYSSLVSLLGD